MQDHPDKLAILAGVAQFLHADLAPQVEDRDLRFRARIASYLVRTVLLELSMAETHDTQELQGLLALLGEDDGEALSSPAERAKRIKALNKALAREIREGRDDPELREHLMRTLQHKLAVVQPGFDLDRDLP